MSVHSAINLDECIEAATIDLLTDETDLIHRFGDELLPTKSGKDRHKLNHVHFVEKFYQSLNGYVWIDCQASTYPLGTYKV